MDPGGDPGWLISVRAMYLAFVSSFVLIGYVAFAEAAALIGFVASLLTGSGWMYPLACAFTAIGFWRLAPTAEHLREDEERLQASGCFRSLVAALRQNPPGRRLSSG